MRALKLAVLSESAADDAAVRVLVEAILGQSLQAVLPAGLRTRGGWPSVLQILPTILKHLHYRTDAEGLVVVVDSDKSPLHRLPVDVLEARECECRRCQLRQVALRTQVELQSPRPAIKLAIGLAVPSIEAWFRCGIDPHVSEATWVQSLQANSFPFTTRSLKRDVYGSDSPGLPLQTRLGIEASQRLSRHLDLLQTFFPSGFGALHRDLREWQASDG